MTKLRKQGSNITLRICPFCHKAFEKVFVRCEACGKLSHLLLFMTGPGLSMKTVVANYLHRVLKIGIVESAYLGPVLNDLGRTDEALRQKRRARMISIMEVYLKDNLSVILDGAFHRRKDRAKVFGVVTNKYPDTSVIMICCISRDKQNREFRRLDRARQDGGLEVDPLSKEESIRLLHEYEVPFEDTFPLTNKRIPIIFFNTDRFIIECINIPDQHALAVEMLNTKEELLRGTSTGKI